MIDNDYSAGPIENRVTDYGTAWFWYTNGYVVMVLRSWPFWEWELQQQLTFKCIDSGKALTKRGARLKAENALLQQYIREVDERRTTTG